ILELRSFHPKHSGFFDHRGSDIRGHQSLEFIEEEGRGRSRASAADATQRRNLAYRNSGYLEKPTTEQGHLKQKGAASAPPFCLFTFCYFQSIRLALPLVLGHPHP